MSSFGEDADPAERGAGERLEPRARSHDEHILVIDRDTDPMRADGLDGRMIVPGNLALEGLERVDQVAVKGTVSH